MEQLQIDAQHQHPGWTDSSLPAFAEELERNATFRSMISDSERSAETRSIADQALALLLPALHPAISAWYGDTGTLLKDLIDRDSLQALDEWLAAEVVAWAGRWSELDPARCGGTGSTPDALAVLRRELDSRHLPPRIAATVSRCDACVPRGTTG
jgi:hypothetical protein